MDPKIEKAQTEQKDTHEITYEIMSASSVPASTAPASTASQTITIVVKSVAGDLFPVDVAPSLLPHDLYLAVYHALPEAIRPDGLYSMKLLRGNENKEEEDEDEDERSISYHGNKEPISLKEGDTLLLVLFPPEEAEYEIEILTGRTIIDLDTQMEYEEGRLFIALYPNKEEDYSRTIYLRHFFVTPFEHHATHGCRILVHTHPSSSIPVQSYRPDQPRRPKKEKYTFHSSDQNIRSLYSYEELLDDFLASPSIKNEILPILRDEWEEYGQMIQRCLSH